MAEPPVGEQRAGAPMPARASDVAPRISVVTPSYNQAQFLEETIRSVLDQQYANLEYIIIDGGSTDGSVEIIRKYAQHLTYWASERDRGQSHAINKGWARSTGEVLAWLNSDDLYLPGALHRVAAAFREHGSSGLIYGDYLILDQRTGRRRPRAAAPVDLVGLLADGYLIPQCSAFVRSPIIQQVGGLDESLHTSMDFDLWLRVLSVSPATYLPGAYLAVWRDHPNTKSRAIASRFAGEMIRILDRFYSRPGLPAGVRRARRRAYAAAFLVGARSAYYGRDTRGAVAWTARALAAQPSLVLRAPAILRRVARRGAAGS